MDINNYLTFDIEEWYHANYGDINFSKYDDLPTSLEDVINRIIDICEKYAVKSTCFVLGSLGEKKPEIVKKLHHAGT